VILDEAQSYGSLAVVNLLSEVRKYGVSVVLATQFLDALGDTTRAALLGNAGTLAVFRCAPADAALLAPHFDELHQAFNPVALQSVPIGEAWINGLPVKIPAPRPLRSADAVKKQSRLHYGKRRDLVERNIMKALECREPQ
jgi:DNA helicase HerA-like ATPase